MPPTRPARSPHRALAAAVVLLLTTAPAVARATTGAPAIEVTDAAGSDLTIGPAAVRAPDGRAELDVVLGADAADDVVVTPRLARPEVADDGAVAVGAGEAVGTVTAGARLRPGERLRVVVTDLAAPTLVVAEARPADGTTGATTVAPAALVLPGAAGTRPSVAIVTDATATRAEVTADAPLLVSVQVGGARPTTYPDRLVLADRPLRLPVTRARWPLPTEVVVTDESGRTAQASTGTVPLVATAGVLVLVAMVGLVAVRRRLRR